jgi:hypothetical protein
MEVNVRVPPGAPMMRTPSPSAGLKPSSYVRFGPAVPSYG